MGVYNNRPVEKHSLLSCPYNMGGRLVRKIPVGIYYYFFAVLNFNFGYGSHDRPNDCRKEMKSYIQTYILEKLYPTSLTCISIDFILAVTKEQSVSVNADNKFMSTLFDESVVYSIPYA